MSQRVPIRSTAKMKELMGFYYMMAKAAENDPNQKIAWITSGGPVEILHAGGVIPIYPENVAAMAGTLKISDEICAIAEEQGFSRDLCSYARTDIGSALSGKGPIMGTASPKPDFLVCCNNICGTVTKWYEELQRIFNVPLIFIDAPFQYGIKDRPEAIDYMEAQLRRMIDQVGEITGNPISWDKLMETLDLADRAVKLWREIQDLLQQKPAPMNSFDTFIHLAPIVTLRGTQGCIEYYETLKSEMLERIEQGIGTLEKEEYRLGWDNLAIWYKIKFLSERFSQHNAALVVSTYTRSFCYQAEDRDVSNPIRAMSADYLAGYINHGLDFRERELCQMVKDFSLDGLVMHSNRSCRAYSFGQYELARTMEEKYGVPVLLIEADQNDTRMWSDEQVGNRIDAFMERVANKKNKNIA